MILKNASITDMLASLGDRRLVCFGAGKILEILCESFQSTEFWSRVDAVIDNSPAKRGTTFEWNGQGKPIVSLEERLAAGMRDDVLLITNNAFYEVYRQLESIPELADTECYIHVFVALIPPPYELPKPKPGAAPKIPRIIHWFWVGNGPIPESNLRCIESWKRFCPGYEIRKWDENSYDVTKHPYMHEAYKARKWGFVPDYARLDVLYEHGGIYLDTDVELVRSLDDLLYDDAFCGMQNPGDVAFGLGFGAIKGHPLILEARDLYDGVSFLEGCGSLNLTASPVYQTQALRHHGLTWENKPQYVGSMRVYPTDVLSPKSIVTHRIDKTKNTYAIHHFDGSWVDGESKNKKNGELKKANELLDLILKNKT